ncbi:MAG: alpha/beta fold hydrolase [Hyphomicrobiaceae bacterium]|nr:alpha/beta fold hydrolase [Hyphomicrobiaceae bacterium]
MPESLPEFQPRPPWWGGDLQTLRNRIVPLVSFPPRISRRLHLPINDGSGDELAALLEKPRGQDAKPDGGPVIILIHGLAGSEDSIYMRASAAFHLKRERTVLRLNLRGAGASRATCGGHYYAGCGGEIVSALGTLDERLLSRGLILIGYSLGGNILINLLAEDLRGLPVVAAASVSPPIEPAQAARRIMSRRNWPYHAWLLRAMKAESTAPGADLTTGERDAIVHARSIYAFDDHFIAPRNGYAGADDYYARTAGARVISAIDAPLLIIHALDDPWIPPAPFLSIEKAAPPNVRIALTASGGHLGFHARGNRAPWHDRCIDTFLEAF